MISPFRRDVLLTGFVLAVPVFVLALRGDFTADDVTSRLLWCLGAGWAVVALLRWATTPPPKPKAKGGARAKAAKPVPEAPDPDAEPAPA